jgi:hypothetical protein
MKKILKLMLVAGFLGFLLPSCELDKYPVDSILFQDSYQSITDATNHWNGLYSIFRTRFNGIFAQPTEVMSDLFNATLPPGSSNIAGVLHRLDVTMLSDNDISAVWRLCYSALVNVNVFLERVNEIPLSSRADTARITNYKGHAHYMRAHLYYILIKHFGVAYNPATAGSDMGVPLVIRYDLNYRPERASVRAIYNFILDELESAEAMIAAQGAARSERITRDAVLALRSKIQLNMRDNARAAATALELIKSGRYPLVTDSLSLLRGWRDDDWSEDILLMYVAETEGVNEQSYFERWDAASQYFAPFFVPTQTVVNLYEESDLRRKIYLSNPTTDVVFANGQRRTGIYFLRKWPITTNYAPSPGNHQHKPKVHRIAEQYLIAAEALGANGLGTVTGIEILTELRAARGATIAVDEANFETMLRGEWVREMIGEGVRIECLKRWGIGFNGRVPQNPNTIAGGDMQEYYSLREAPANYYRFTWPVPLNEIRTNPNIRQTQSWIDLR